jgi:hypothetical protein
LNSIHFMDDPAEALEEARKAGIDLDLLDANLALTVEERMAQHAAALKLALELQADGLIDEIEAMRIDQVYAIAAKRRTGGA